MRAADGAGLGLRYTLCAVCARALIYRVMDGAHERIGNGAFVKTSTRCVDLYELRFFVEGRFGVFARFLKNKSRRACFADAWRAVYQDVLRILAAKRRLERPNTLVLTYYVAKGGGTRKLAERDAQRTGAGRSELRKLFSVVLLFCKNALLG